MNYENLRGKYVLFDTNIVINYGRYRNFYQSFIDQLFENQCTPVISPIIEIELYAHINEQERTILDNLIGILSKGNPEDIKMPFRSDLKRKAIEMGSKYQNASKKGKPVQLGDLLIGAEMMLYRDSNNLVLATENHIDFPPSIFNRIGIETIDCEDSIHVIGFYTVKSL